MIAFKDKSAVPIIDITHDIKTKKGMKEKLCQGGKSDSGIDLEMHEHNNRVCHLLANYWEEN